MRTRDSLERLYSARPPASRDHGSVDLLVQRAAPGEHATPSEAMLTREAGMVGDRWAKGWRWQRDVDRQLTLMMTGVADLVCDGQPLHLPGDNLLVSLDLGTEALPVGARLRAGAVVLEVTKKPHNGCKKFMQRFGEEALAWINDEKGRARRLRGVNCRVIEPGLVHVGDAIDVISR